MRTVRTVAELRTALHEPRREGRAIGLVPTMGALHEGHLSLIRRARRDCDDVVVSLFVNPAQFEDAADLDAYPRDEASDASQAAAAGADLLFAPAPGEVYPPGFATTVSVAGISERLEGAYRGRGHFDGVTTVVTKLLGMAGPDLVFFGQKDAQQALVVRRLVRDLDIPVRVEVCPTVREADGLALSSRNVRLTAADRRRAPALFRSLQAVEAAVGSGERDPRLAIQAGLDELDRAGIAPEYLELTDPESLAPVERAQGPLLALVAARLGEIRLIDNLPIQAPPI